MASRYLVGWSSAYRKSIYPGEAESGGRGLLKFSIYNMAYDLFHK